MDLLGLAEYNSESDQENDQKDDDDVSQSETNSRKELSSSTFVELKSDKTLRDITLHSAESSSSSSKCTATAKDVPTLLQNVSSGSDDSQFALKYPNLSKLPKLDPTIKPDPVAVETVKYHINAIKLHNFSLIENIRNDKDSGNPYILAKVVDHFKIDEIGSMYPKEMFNPHGYPEEDYIDQIFNYGTTTTSSAPPPEQQQQLPLGFQQQQQPSDMVCAAVATTAAAMSTIQQQMAARMNRTASYANAMADLTQQALQYVANQQQSAAATVTGSSTVSLTALASNVHISSTATTFTDRHERKRKSKWDDPSAISGASVTTVGSGGTGPTTVPAVASRSQQEIADLAASIMRR